MVSFSLNIPAKLNEQLFIMWIHADENWDFKFKISTLAFALQMFPQACDKWFRIILRLNSNVYWKKLASCNVLIAIF